MGIRPSEDLPDGERGQVSEIAHPAAFRQQPGQRRTAGQAAEAIAQGRINPAPVVAKLITNKAGVRPGPQAGSSVMCIAPGQYLGLGQPGPNMAQALESI